MVDFSVIGAEQDGMIEGQVHTGAWGSASNGNMNNRTSFGSNRTLSLTLAASGERRASFGVQGDGDLSWATTNEMVTFYDSSDNLIFALDTDTSEQFRAAHYPGGVRTLIDGVYTPTQLDTMNDGYAHFNIDMDAGTVKLYINNVLDSEWSGIDFDSFPDVRKMVLNGQLVTYISGWFANDGEGMTQWLVEAAWPTSDGTDVDGVGTYANVDEAAYSAADYISLENNQKHSFNFSSRTLPFTKAAISLNVIARRTATGPTHIRAYLLIGGVRYYGSAKVLTEQAQTFMEIWNLNPATGLEWDKAVLEGTSGFEGGWEALTV